MGVCWWPVHGLRRWRPRGFAGFAGYGGGGFAGLDDGEGEVLEFGEQRAEFFGVVEQWLPGGELFGGEPAGDGLAADFAGPFGVGAVPGGGAGVAAAAGLAAFVGA